MYGMEMVQVTPLTASSP